MTQDIIDPDDRPLTPPVHEGGRSLLPWAVASVALLLLAVGAYQAYEWLVRDVARRRAVVEQPVVARPASGASSIAAPSSPARQPGAVPQLGAQEPQAPAVAGGAVNKCVADGQVTYTNAACPEGSAVAQGAAAGMDPNGVVGSAGDSVPAIVPRPVGLPAGDDPGAKNARCSFLTAEITRLDYEFRQPLPPPVLDHISSRLVGLRDQAAAAQCARPAKAADAAASAPVRKRAPAKVVEEKADKPVQ